MKQISLAEFKKMSRASIEKMGCVVLTADGEECAVVIVGAVGGMRHKVEGISSLINANRPQENEQ